MKSSLSILLVAALAFVGPGAPAQAAQDPVNVGSTPNDGKGDPLRTAAIKLNKNDAELYAAIANIQSILATLSLVSPVTSVAGRQGDVVLSSTDLSDASSLGRSILANSSPSQILSLIGGAPVGSVASLSGATFTGQISTPKVVITGSGSTGDISGMSVTPTDGGAQVLSSALAARLPRSLTGPPATSATFVGSGTSATFGQNVNLTATSSNSREIGAQFGINSSVGDKNPAYDKLGIVYFALGGPNSAPVYGANGITQGYAGPGGYLVTGHESDINNIGAHADTIGSSTASYGNVSVAAGNFRSTAGYWATGATTSWNYGFAVSNYGSQPAISSAGFFDASTSTTVLQVQNTHTTLIDALNANLSFGMVLPNNIPGIFQKDGGGTLRNVVKVDASSYLNVGDAGLAGTKLASPVIEPTAMMPASSSAPCVVGQHSWDNNYEYRCVAANTWKRIALTSW